MHPQVSRITPGDGGIRVHLLKMGAQVPGAGRGRADASGRLYVGRLIQRPVAHDEPQFDLVEYRGIHERIDPLKDFRGHERQFLKREVVLAADDEDAVPCAERPCQRRDVRPHDHFPVLPQANLHELLAASERGQHGTQPPAKGKHAVRPFVLVPALRDAVVVAHGASFGNVPGEALSPGFFQLQWRKVRLWDALSSPPGNEPVKQIYPNHVWEYYSDETVTVFKISQDPYFTLNLSVDYKKLAEEEVGGKE